MERGRLLGREEGALVRVVGALGGAAVSERLEVSLVLLARDVVTRQDAESDQRQRYRHDEDDHSEPQNRVSLVQIVARAREARRREQPALDEQTEPTGSLLDYQRRREEEPLLAPPRAHLRVLDHVGDHARDQHEARDAGRSRHD
eukprot:2707258-Prymnesium_polylepis.2